MASFSQGDVVRVPFPYTDQETRQRRPALVVSDGAIGRDRSLLWVAMITSADNSPWPHDVPVLELDLAGLPAPSKVRAAKLATIESGHCERLGSLETATTKAALDAIRRQLGAPPDQ